MSDADLARDLVIAGLVWFGIYWWWPESAKLFGDIAVWRAAPLTVARLAQRRGRALYLFGVLCQLWAIVMIATGISLWVGLIRRPADGFIVAEFTAISIPYVVSAIVVLVRKRRSRR